MRHTKQCIKCVVGILGFIILNAQDSHAQDTQVQPLPETEHVLTAIDQNAVKLSNFSVRSILIRTTSPGFWGSAEAENDPAGLVKTKKVKIQRDLGISDNGRVYLDQLETQIAPAGDLQTHIIYWHDPEKGVNSSLSQRLDYYKDGKVSQLNAGVPTAYENQDNVIPFAALGHLQIKHNLKSRQSADLRSFKAHVLKKENYRGLDCIRLEWNSPPLGGYDIKGFALVCPERDYKEVYREMEAVSNNPNGAIRKYTQKRTVNSIKKVGDAWLPSDITFERQDYYDKGEIRSLKERFRLVDFQIEPDNSIFSPSFSPGTRVFGETLPDGKTKLTVAGGDISELRTRLRMGDFSVLDAEAGALNQP